MGLSTIGFRRVDHGIVGLRPWALGLRPWDCRRVDHGIVGLYITPLKGQNMSVFGHNHEICTQMFDYYTFCSRGVIIKCLVGY